MSTCKECGRKILFYPTVNDKMMPIDPTPVEIGGNCYIEGGRVLVLKKEETRDGPLYVMHRVTCPERSARPDDTKIANPLDAVKRIRQEVRSEREAKQADETHTDPSSGHTDRRQDGPQPGPVPLSWCV